MMKKYFLLFLAAPLLAACGEGNKDYDATGNFIVCLILLSGLFTPVASMPAWAQWLTIINPCRWFIDGVRTVFVRGGDIGCVVPELLILSAFAVVMDCWAVRSYRKRG